MNKGFLFFGLFFYSKADDFTKVGNVRPQAGVYTGVALTEALPVLIGFPTTKYGLFRPGKIPKSLILS